VKALRELGLRPSIVAPEPNTWRELLAAMEAAGIPFAGWRVAVQEYGESNEEFLEALRERGCRVLPTPVYRWGLPEDLEPLRRAIAAVAGGRADAVLFTSARQVEHVLQVAGADGGEASLRAGLERALVASIGPVCSAAMRARGLRVDVEPQSPRMGHLVRAAAGAVEEGARA